MQTPNLHLNLFAPLGVGWREDATAGELLDDNMVVLDAAVANAGTVKSVNGHVGVVVLSATDVGADTFGSAATAQSNAEGYTDSKVPHTTVRVANSFFTSYDASTDTFGQSTIAASDVPSLDASKITTGTLALTRGGTATDLSATGGAHSFLAQDASHVVSARAIGTGDVPSGVVTWDLLGNATGNLTLANANYTTEFDQTSAVAWLWKNTTTGTSGTTNASPLLELAANAFHGGASTADTWTIGSSLAAGTDAASTLTIAHVAGSTGAAVVQVPALTSAGVVTVPVGSSSSNGLQFAGTTVGCFQTSSSFNIQGPLIGVYSGTTQVGQVGLGSNWNGVNVFTMKSVPANNVASILSGLTTGTALAGVCLGGNGGTGQLLTATSGTQKGIGIPDTGASQVQMSFAPTSGYANFIGVLSGPIINNTSPGPTITSAIISSATSAAVTIGSTTGYVVGAPVTIANVSTAGFTGLNGTWVVASATATVLTMTTVGLVAKSQAACNGNVLFGAWNPTIGNYTAFQIAVTETAAPGPANKLIDCYAGAAGTTAEFSVDNKGTIINAGGRIVKRAAKNANYTSTAADYVLTFTATATLTLDSGAAVSGTTYRIKLGTAAAVGSILTVTPNNSKTVEGQASMQITIVGNSVDLVYDGTTNWEIF